MHKETIKKIVTDPVPQSELLSVIKEMKAQSLKTISLTDKDAEGKDIALNAIDPFSFFANFNRKSTDRNRKANWEFLKRRWNLKSDVPGDFDGIPILNPLRSWFFPWQSERVSDHFDLLWSMALQGATRTVDNLDTVLVDRCLDLECVTLTMLTIGLFWINPYSYLPADKKTVAYGKAKGVQSEPDDFLSYKKWIAEMTQSFGGNYPEVSHSAYIFAAEKAPQVDSENSSMRRYWCIGTGKNGQNWDEFHEKGIIAIGFDPIEDLRHFSSRNEIQLKMQELHPDKSSLKNNSLACWQFAQVIRRGDIVFAKQGTQILLGCGVVEGDYVYDPERSALKHVRTVKWLAEGNWSLPEDHKMALKTLTDITQYPGHVAFLAKTAGVPLDDASADEDQARDQHGASHWWLNANPKIWNFEDLPVGGRQTYTTHNERGNKRQKYKYFEEVRTGDSVIGYVTSPDKEVVALCRITQGLHETEEGESIEIEKIEQFAKPIPLEVLKDNPDLQDCEPLISNQGSLFKVTAEQFDVIRSLIDDVNPPHKSKPQKYTTAMAMQDLFFPEAEFENMLQALREKKNIVLQGPPGVGKTFVADRLAFALMGVMDRDRMEMVQFHQSYSYEDFIQGFRPTSKGTFDLKRGIFYQFCRRTQRDETSGKPYVFIIDEINRGNLSKIFGELMMLIEPDKRGKRFAMPLAYSEDSEERFYIPENLYLIGTMNTADRSLAMVDYALRRRFRFLDLDPAFKESAFSKFLENRGVTKPLIAKIVDRMTALNKDIEDDAKNLGCGYRIGHSYFCPRDSMPADEAWYRRVIQSEILPLIQEYWFDDEQKVNRYKTLLLAE